MISRTEQAQSVQAEHHDVMKENEQWALVDANWLDTWAQFVGFDFSSGQIVSQSSQDPPAMIDNSRLLEPNKVDVRRGVEENRDYKIVHKNVWSLLIGWYHGGPEILREVIAVGLMRQTRLDLFPIVFRLTDANPESGAPQPPPFRDFYISRKRTFQNMIDLLDGGESSGLENGSTKIRLWMMEDEKLNPVSEPDLAGSWHQMQGPDLAIQLDNFQFDSQILVMVERQKADGSWPRHVVVKNFRDFAIQDIIDAKDTVGRWYESTVRDVKDGRVFVHYNQWVSTWDEWLPVDSDRLAPRNTHTTGPIAVKQNDSYAWSSRVDEGRPDEPGIVGLANLGNTCFMNSTLQCMSNTPHLTEFFVTDDYLGQINRSNPLGWQGRIAEEYGSMIKDIWSNRFRVVTPRKFKEVLGEFQPRFSGYQQQDSQELLAFLTDGLHEDLNRVKKKPATNTVESNGRPDAEVARDAWEVHLKRNQSIITDLMQGQLKSKLVCPVCHKVSITFDPFSFFSAPLPSEKNTTFTVAFISKEGRICRMPVTVSRMSGTMRDAKAFIANVMQVSVTSLVAADIFGARCYKVLADSKECDFQSNDFVYVYEVEGYDSSLVPEPAPVSYYSYNSYNSYGPTNYVTYPIEGMSTASAGATSSDTHKSTSMEDEGSDAAQPGTGAGAAAGEGENTTEKKTEETVVAKVKLPALCQVIQQKKERSIYYDKYPSGKEFNIDPMGIPMFITVPWSSKAGEVRERVLNVVKPLLAPRAEGDLSGAVVFLKSATGAFISARANACLAVADSGQDEKWTVKSVDGQLAFKSLSGLFLSCKHGSEEDVSVELVALPDGPNADALFVRDQGGLKSSRAKWLRIGHDGRVELTGEWASVMLEPSSDPDAPVVLPSMEVFCLKSDARSCYKCNNYTCDGCALPEDDEFPLMESIAERGIREVSFAVRFKDSAALSQRLAWDLLPRHISAEQHAASSKQGLDLASCMQAFTAEEVLSAEDPWYCSQCKEHRCATKKMELWRLPSILIVHLKRFVYSKMYRDKISTLIQFPITGLDLSQFCNNPDEQRAGDPPIYDLFAVSNHYGGMGGGHYTAYCKNLVNKKWYHFDDSRVTPINESEVVSDAAYVLYYHRRNRVT